MLWSSTEKSNSALLRAWIYLVGVVVDASWDEDEGEVDGGDEGGEVGHPHPHLASQLALLQNISLAMLLKTSNVWRVTPNGPAAKEFPRWSNGCQFKIRTYSSRPQDSSGSSKQYQKKFATKVWDHYICCANSFKFLQGIHIENKWGHEVLVLFTVWSRWERCLQTGEWRGSGEASQLIRSSASGPTSWRSDSLQKTTSLLPADPPPICCH